MSQQEDWVLVFSVLLPVFLLTLSQIFRHCGVHQVKYAKFLKLIWWFFFCEEFLRDSQEMTMLLGFHISMMAGK
jgi:hypothetical protein